MRLNYLAFGILAILVIMYLEYLYAKRKKVNHVFKYESTVANLSVGILDRLFDLFCSALFYSIYYAVYNRWHLFDIGNTWYIWIILLLATDLVWYWYHRLGHEINILWAAHIVHHHSEEFNYTAAVRITVFQAFIRTAFWSILPLIGFQPQMVIPILLFHGIYSFFTHTRLIGKLGLLEYVLITPSLHRVHHASDEKYLDKNYGDIFVFWDKLFGTFMKEEEEPRYGIVHPLQSNSFLWQHFHYYLEIWVAFVKAPTLKAKFLAIFGGPKYMNPNIRKVLERKFNIKKNPITLKSSLKRYVNLQIAACLMLLILQMFFFYYLSAILFALLFLLILLTLINCGALLDQKGYVYYLEIMRIGVFLLFLPYLFGVSWETVFVCFIGLSLASTPICKVYYQRFLFASE